MSFFLKTHVSNIEIIVLCTMSYIMTILIHICAYYCGIVRCSLSVYLDPHLLSETAFRNDRCSLSVHLDPHLLLEGAYFCGIRRCSLFVRLDHHLLPESADYCNIARCSLSVHLDRHLL